MQGRLLQGQVEGVKTLAWSPDSNLLAAASEDMIIRFWDRDGDFIKQMEGHRSIPFHMAWSPDGELLVSAEPGYTSTREIPGVIKIWRRNGELVKSQKLSPIRSLAWSNDSSYLATGSNDRLIRIWNREGQFVKALEAHSGRVYSLAWSPRGQLLTSSSDLGDILFWDEDGHFKKVQHPGSKGEITQLCWSPDGLLLVSYGGKRICYWNEAGEKVKDLIDVTNTELAHSERIIEIEWTPDGKLLASTSWDSTIKYWNRDGTCIRIIKAPDTTSGSNFLLVPRSISWAPDGDILASTFNDGLLRFWNRESICIGTANLNLIRMFEPPSKGSRFSSAAKNNFDDKVLWAPDGETLSIWERNIGSIVLLNWITEDIDRLLTKKWARIKEEVKNSDENHSTCRICFQKFQDNENLNRCYFCNTNFHAHCILKWIIEGGNKICPVCNNLFITLVIA
ncbi:MAG: eIF2A-related protein [Candidatus Helarchaeota archaeon]